MKVVKNILDPSVVETLIGGGAVVLRTDTLYGMLARADNHTAVQRVYDLKNRNAAKSPIVLIASAKQMFDEVPPAADRLIQDGWPERTSIILPAVKAPDWLTRGNRSVAYRVPNVKDLLQLIDMTGAVIAPSANPEGQSPAMNVEQAIDYFGEGVDVYVDGGKVTDDTPSRLIRLNNNGEIERLR